MQPIQPANPSSTYPRIPARITLLGYLGTMQNPKHRIEDRKQAGSSYFNLLSQGALSQPELVEQARHLVSYCRTIAKNMTGFSGQAARDDEIANFSNPTRLILRDYLGT